MTSEAAYKAWETRRANGWVHPNARDVVQDAKPKPTVKAVKPMVKKAVKKTAKPAVKVRKTTRPIVRSKAVTKSKGRRG